jgi:hypothetical protein
MGSDIGIAGGHGTSTAPFHGRPDAEAYGGFNYEKSKSTSLQYIGSVAILKTRKPAPGIRSGVWVSQDETLEILFTAPSHAQMAEGPRKNELDTAAALQ